LSSLRKQQDKTIRRGERCFSWVTVYVSAYHGVSLLHDVVFHHG